MIFDGDFDHDRPWLADVWLRSMTLGGDWVTANYDSVVPDQRIVKGIRRWPIALFEITYFMLLFGQ